MALFITKEWKDRLVEFAGRRKLKNVSTNEETVFDVSRNEGAVSQEGDAFSAKNMNDLEQRIKDGFDKVDANLTNVRTYVGDDGKLHFTDSAGADTVLNFNNLELICNFRPSYASTTYTLENGILKSSTEDNFGTTNILRTYDNDGHDVITIKKKCKIMYCGFYYPPTIKEVEAGFSNEFYRPDTNYLGYFLAIIG